MNRIVAAFLCVLLCSALRPAAAAGGGATQTVGWIERVRLGPQGVTVEAKLDTGADTSSLHATEVRRFHRDDGEWVAFEVVGADGRKARFERRVVRIARIRQHSGGVQKRPTVLIGVCLGKIYRLTEVNLTDRSGFNYEFLVGRSFLAPYFVVDSARTHTVEPQCPETEPR
jgi:hypothetical protein